MDLIQQFRHMLNLVRNDGLGELLRPPGVDDLTQPERTAEQVETEAGIE